MLGSCFLKNFRSCQCTLPMGAVASGAKHGPSVGYFTWQHWYTCPNCCHTDSGIETPLPILSMLNGDEYSIHIPTIPHSGWFSTLPNGDLCLAPWRKSDRFKGMGCGCLDLPWGLKQLLLGYFPAISVGSKDAKAFKTMMIRWWHELQGFSFNFIKSRHRHKEMHKNAESSMVWFFLFALELSDTVGGLGKDLHQTSWGLNQLPQREGLLTTNKSLWRKCAIDCYWFSSYCHNSKGKFLVKLVDACFIYRGN